MLSIRYIFSLEGAPTHLYSYYTRFAGSAPDEPLDLLNPVIGALHAG